MTTLTDTVICGGDSIRVQKISISGGRVVESDVLDDRQSDPHVELDPKIRILPVKHQVMRLRIHLFVIHYDYYSEF